MSHLKRLLGPVVIPILGLIALTDTGCATTIAGEFAHLERRKICVHLPEDPEASEYLLTKDGTILSNFKLELVRQEAPSARVVLEFDPLADPDSVRQLPPQYQHLECAPVFSMLPSKYPDIAPPPDASLALVVHEQRPEPVSKALGEELAKCGSHITGQVTPGQYAMQINAYVKNDGQMVAAFVADSTFKDRKLIACVAKVLRSTQWSPLQTSAPNVAVAPVALKGLMAQAEPAQPLPDSGPESGIRRIQPQPFTPPANAPTGTRIPRIFVIPIGPIAAAVALFGIIYFWSDNDAPAWASEMNPITRQPYTSRWEYDEIQQMTPAQIREAQIKATQSQPPPAPAPPPTPTLTPEQQREQEKKREKCEKLAGQIKGLMEAKRDPTPKGGRPQGRKGIIERWDEIARNIGKWQPQPDGKPSKRMEGHFAAYAEEQRQLVKAIDKWEATKCEDKEHGLPRNARQYAAQTPEYGPGKPLEPAPLPKYEKIPTPPAIVPQAKKGSK